MVQEPMELDSTTAGSLVDLLRSRLPSSVVELDYPIGSMTTYRVGGSASLFVEVGSEDDLHELAAVVRAEAVPITVLGRGSNMLVADNGYAGMVVHLGECFGHSGVTADGDIRVGAAASLPVLARQLTAAGHRGFEWAVGVPGSVGGAVRMNAGGHGADMADSVLRVQMVDLAATEVVEKLGAELGFGYRRSLVGANQVVISADLNLSEGDPAEGQAILAEVVAWRRRHQPGGQNAGSVFTNPEGDSAGRLIEAAGLKGLRIGTAVVSPKHANFIQADVGGSAADVVSLMQEIIMRVSNESGVLLRAETRMLGFASDESSLMFDPREFT